MDKSYIAGMFDGDGSILIAKIPLGFQLKVELSQCDKSYLEGINQHFDNTGSLYEDTRSDKYVGENCWKLRFTGEACTHVLDLMKHYSIIKYKQAELALEYLQLQHKQGMYEERESIYQKMKNFNKFKLYTKPYERLNNAYISGLFDAEGNVYIGDGNKFKYYVKITQKCDEELISKMKDYLGFGRISPSEKYRLRFFSKADIFAFHSVVEDTNKIKIFKLLELMQKLL
jgi:hypothetical protein